MPIERIASMVVAGGKGPIPVCYEWDPELQEGCIRSQRNGVRIFTGIPDPRWYYHVDSRERLIGLALDCEEAGNHLDWHIPHP